jgi:hypothetical protein
VRSLQPGGSRRLAAGSFRTEHQCDYWDPLLGAVAGGGTDACGSPNPSGAHAPLAAVELPFALASAADAQAALRAPSDRAMASGDRR